MLDPEIILHSSFAKPLIANPINYVDIGARGGFQEDLLPISFCVNAVGFEPDPKEFAVLEKKATSPWRSQQILPYGISAHGGKKSLYIPDDPLGASLLRPNPQVCDPFNKSQFFKVREEIQIDTRVLSEVLKEIGVTGPDYLKLDIEGAEHQVLETLKALFAGISMIKVEVSFMPFREGHPVASEIERFMNSHGFQLIDIVGATHWRFHGNITHPFLSKEEIPYSRAQLVHGDYLFLRSFETLDFKSDTGRRHAFKVGVLAMAFGYFDSASRIFLVEEMLEWLSDKGVDDVKNTLHTISVAYGRAAFRHSFLNQIRGLFPFLRRISHAF